MMVKHDLEEAEKELHLKNGGYEVKNYYEQERENGVVIFMKSIIQEVIVYKNYWEK